MGTLMLTMIELLLISIPVGFLGALTGLGGASILISILVTLGVRHKQTHNALTFCSECCPFTGN